MTVFVHETSIVDDGAIVGDGTKIWHFSHVQAGAQIGQNCVLGQNVNVGCEAIIGDDCKIQNNVSIYDGVVLEDNVFCGPSCVFTNDLFPRAHSSQGWEISKTLVKEGASIGANATVVCGHTIGRYAMLGSGSVCTRDVPDYALVVGNPARQIGWVCECGARLNDSLVCSCGLHYKENEQGLVRIN